MESYEKLLQSIKDIQEYCEVTPKFSEFLGTVKDIRIELEFQNNVGGNCADVGKINTL